MTRTLTETINVLKTDVSQDKYPNLRTLQGLLTRSASPSKDPALSAVRCLTIFHKSELRTIFGSTITTTDFQDTSNLGAYSTTQAILNSLTGYDRYINLALAEAKSVMSKSVFATLSEYNTVESSLNRLNLIIFLILIVNTQG